MSRHDERRLERDARRAEQSSFQPLEQDEETRITSDMSPAEIEFRIRRRVEKRRKAISSFVSNLIAYIAVNAMLWTIFGFTAREAHGFPWPLFVTLGWGLGVVIQGYQIYRNSSANVARRENAISREVERMKAQMGLDSAPYYSEKPKNAEKPKNDQQPIQPMRLTDDGEMVPAQTESESDMTADPQYMNVRRSQNNQ